MKGKDENKWVMAARNLCNHSREVDIKCNNPRISFHEKKGRVYHVISDYPGYKSGYHHIKR